MITEEQLGEIIAFGREQHHVEFKGPGSRNDKQLFARVVRAMMGMANRRDGGLVILGVRDVRGNLEATGLSDSELATWKYDDFADSVYSYADPTVRFETERRKYKGACLLIVEVHEFDDLPIFCKKSYGDVLAEGALYTRGRRKPETTAVRSVSDMRDFVELATQKNLRKLLSILGSIGIDLRALASPTDEQRFDEQRSDLK